MNWLRAMEITFSLAEAVCNKAVIINNSEHVSSKSCDTLQTANHNNN